MDPKELQRRSRHEALHGLFAQRAYATIDEVRVVPEALTLCAFPISPWSLRRKFKELPDGTKATTTKIISALIAPAIITGEYLDGGDRDEFEQWEQAWTALPKACSWQSLTTAARSQVSEWYQGPGRPEFVSRVAEALARRGHVWGDAAWRKLVQECKPPRPAAPQTPAAPPNFKKLLENIKCLQRLPVSDWRACSTEENALVHRS
jgi:hypothetical protein